MIFDVPVHTGRIRAGIAGQGAMPIENSGWDLARQSAHYPGSLRWHARLCSDFLAPPLSDHFVTGQRIQPPRTPALASDAGISELSLQI